MKRAARFSILPTERRRAARAFEALRPQRANGLRRPFARSGRGVKRADASDRSTSARVRKSPIWTGFGRETVFFCGFRSFPGLSRIGVPRFELWTRGSSRTRPRSSEDVRSRSATRFPRCRDTSDVVSPRQRYSARFGRDLDGTRARCPRGKLALSRVRTEGTKTDVYTGRETP